MLKSIMSFSVSNIVNLFIGLFTVVVLTRVFSPEVYGVVNIFNTTVATGLSILYMGLDSSYIRFYNEPPINDSNKDLGTKLLLCCLIITFICALIFSIFFHKEFAYCFFGFENRIIVIMIFVSICAQLILRFLNIKYRMDFNIKQFTIQSVLTQIISKLFIVLAALLSFTINGVVSFSACSILAFSLLHIYVQRKMFFSFKNINNFEDYRKVFLFATFSAPLPVCMNVNISLTQQIITHLLDVSSVGVYSSAGYFSSILGALQGGFTTYWAAYMYRNYKYKQNEIKQVNEYLLLCIIVVFACMILGRDVIYLLIGSDYHESKDFFSLVLSYPIFMLAAETTSYGISIMNKMQYFFACFIVSICINLWMTYTLIPIVGLKGAAVASFVSGVFLYISRTIIGQRLYNSISDIKVTIIDNIIIILMALIPSVFSDVLSNVFVPLLLVMALIINKERIFCIKNKLIGLIKLLLNISAKG
ncbi:lipopolysaccharide biosynthesis protein [Selenomonas ruminis]|uniref:Oligosaccharide flippase family protein n=1 Tax=Selenomonas ruminis TaxID=2593411 RepID=A0A5D6W952_9FIRM|nr:oligosaccharide flippase family protein [Selenomonas sp. mPRGC5]TYZ24507.1 oligosaccharide flippase family protein [Selenomonas sp. mPRGC5]